MTTPGLGWLRRHPLPADVLLAAALVGLEVSLVMLLPPEVRPSGVGSMVLLSVVCAVPVILRRMATRLAVAAALATLTVPALLRQAPASQSLAFIVLTFTIAAGRPMRRAVVGTALLWLPVMALNLLSPISSEALGDNRGYVLLNNLLIALVSFFVGRTVHARRTSVAALRERARVAEESQRALADQAVADERRRIARELHDVVAHHVSVMGVLATGARRVLPKDRDTVDGALGNIEETSRTALRELRRLLDVLRTEAEPAADLAPQPGLAGIESLVEQVRDAGLPVTLTVDGEPRPLDPGVALTIYRIVQEALTNALKHAGRATGQVRITFGSAWLVLEITDTGRGPRPDSERVGHGLVGMRERVALYGGSLRTGPRPGGGFLVHARIPVEQLGAPVGEGAA
ncbi:sensor histidine kinase [Plantactinospora sp. GCM10030261]|uniref:sensor histidine kinase n=1 Tax=Plantactinospora sp. GCM10030261 TaxID=3273420 RepID=UPI003619284E